MSTKIPRVTHYGIAHFGDVECEAVVLEDGRRGFVRRQMLQAIGLKGNFSIPQLRPKLAEISAKALEILDNSGSTVLMPHGIKATFVDAEIVPETAVAVVEQAANGKLHPQRLNMLAPCLKIISALSRVGLTALIDEATGYQYHREPNALQDLFTRLIRQTAADWERRFHPEFYQAIYRLFKWHYDPSKPKPHIVGKITQDWVYEPIFPSEIITEIKERQTSEKMHQWLTEDGGLKLLEKQRDAVMMIALSSVDYADFNARCSVAFFRRGQVSMLFPHESD